MSSESLNEFLKIVVNAWLSVSHLICVCVNVQQISHLYAIAMNGLMRSDFSLVVFVLSPFWINLTRFCSGWVYFYSGCCDLRLWHSIYATKYMKNQQRTRWPMDLNEIRQILWSFWFQCCCCLFSGKIFSNTMYTVQCMIEIINSCNQLLLRISVTINVSVTLWYSFRCLLGGIRYYLQSLSQITQSIDQSMLLFARYSHALMVTMYAIYCVCGLCAFFFFLFILFLSPSLSTSFLSNSVCLCFSPIQYEKEKRKNATQLCVLNLSLMPRIVFILFFVVFFLLFFSSLFYLVVFDLDRFYLSF